MNVRGHSGRRRRPRFLLGFLGRLLSTGDTLLGVANLENYLSLLPFVLWFSSLLFTIIFVLFRWFFYIGFSMHWAEKHSKQDIFLHGSIDSTSCCSLWFSSLLYQKIKKICITFLWCLDIATVSVTSFLVIWNIKQNWYLLFFHLMMNLLVMKMTVTLPHFWRQPPIHFWKTATTFFALQLIDLT